MRRRRLRFALSCSSCAYVVSIDFVKGCSPSLYTQLSSTVNGKFVEKILLQKNRFFRHAKKFCLQRAAVELDFGNGVPRRLVFSNPPSRMSRSRCIRCVYTVYTTVGTVGSLALLGPSVAVRRQASLTHTTVHTTSPYSTLQTRGGGGGIPC